jgi:hypothetical protein
LEVTGARTVAVSGLVMDGVESFESSTPSFHRGGDGECLGRCNDFVKDVKRAPAT